MDRLPLEIINYLCTFLSKEDIMATFTEKKILASGVALDLWKVESKEQNNTDKVEK